MYTCGPTVYRPVHLGNLRSYLLADWLRRALELFGNRVTAVKNITDVGHMRQEAVERGEDKVIAAALAAGKTPKEIAESYEAAFHVDERRLGILRATHFPRATDHVPEMVAIIRTLIARGFAYEVEGTVYFAVRRFPGYGKLSGNVGTALKHGVRAELDPRKRDEADFALWKRAEPDRPLVWESPWGPGFPGWHIECSAMSTRYLGERFDLHTGGVDNVFPHHEDEIAQSEAAFGHASVRHWVHGQHLLAGGLKMAKSARNAVTVDDLVELGIDPLAFRYECLLTHYRAPMHFSLGALRQSAEGLEQHRAARAAVDYARADLLRASFDGYRVDDVSGGGAVVSRGDRRVAARERRTISSAKELPDRRADPASLSWSIAVVTSEYPADLARCCASLLRFLPADAELLVLDSGSGADAQARLDAIAESDERVHAVFADRDLGDGAARNALLRIARGRLILELDTSIELVGDLLGPLAHALAEPRVGLAGPWGLRSNDLKQFAEVTTGDVDAVQGYCLAAARDVLLEIRGFDERYRFYRNLDIAVSLAVGERGYRARALGSEHVRRHVHRLWESLSEDERLKRSRRNFDRMYRRFHGRARLLAGTA